MKTTSLIRRFALQCVARDGELGHGDAGESFHGEKYGCRGAKVVKFKLVPDPNGTATVTTHFGALTATSGATVL